MLRTSVLSIVLLLAVGPDTTLLCRLWCHPHADVATFECQETAAGAPPTLVMAVGERCAEDASGAPFVREDLRRIVDDSVRVAVVAASYCAVAAPGEPQHAIGPGRVPARELSVRFLPLRI